METEKVKSKAIKKSPQKSNTNIKSKGSRMTIVTINSKSKTKSQHEPVTAKDHAVVDDHNPGAAVVILSDKYVVEESFLDAVENQFLEIYPHLLEDVDFTPAELVGETYWTGLSEEGQRLAILCLKHLATENEVPLVDVTCECCGISSFEIV